MATAMSEAPVNVETMEAGREMDLAILCDVLGFPRRKVFYEAWDDEHEFPKFIPSGKPKRTHEIDAKPVLHFSTDPAAAMAALDRWPELVELRRVLGHWRCALGEARPFSGPAGRLWQAEADTAALAICRCLLLAARDGVQAKAER